MITIIIIITIIIVMIIIMMIMCLFHEKGCPDQKILRKHYFRLLNGASAPEILDFGVSKRPPPTTKHNGKGGRRGPPPFPRGFAVVRGRSDPKKYTISGPEALASNMQHQAP